MPIPLIPIISALVAGGTLVPHAAGGMIVTSTTGYVVGTYLSTAAIGGLITTATATLGTGALWLTGAASSAIGSAGILGSTIGASGITGALMSVGIISSTPIWVPFAAGGALGGAALGCGYGGYRLYKFRQKLTGTPSGEEAQFTEGESKFVEKIIKRLAKIKGTLNIKSMVTLEQAFDEAQKNNRVCPQPIKWSELYDLLPNKEQKGNDWEPALPLILAAWHDTPAMLKISRLREHIEWAHKHNDLEVIFKYMKNLKEDEWFHIND